MQDIWNSHHYLWSNRLGGNLKFDRIVLCRSQEVKRLDTSSYQKNIPEIQYPPVDGIVEQKIIVKCQALMCKFNGAGGAEVPFPGSRSYRIEISAVSSSSLSPNLLPPSLFSFLFSSQKIPPSHNFCGEGQTRARELNTLRCVNSSRKRQHDVVVVAAPSSFSSLFKQFALEGHQR